MMRSSGSRPPMRGWRRWWTSSTLAASRLPKLRECGICPSAPSSATGKRPASFCTNASHLPKLPSSMMKIDSTRWGELSPLLDQVLELAGEERAAWLEALRATRPEVVAELQTLLAELQALDDAGFLEGDPSRMLGQPSLVGQTFGAYTI